METKRKEEKLTQVKPEIIRPRKADSRTETSIRREETETEGERRNIPKNQNYFLIIFNATVLLWDLLVRRPRRPIIGSDLKYIR